MLNRIIKKSLLIGGLMFSLALFTPFTISSYAEDTVVKEDTAVKSENKLKAYQLNGFRAAKFGATKTQVLKAIEKNFSVKADKVKITTDNEEKTEILSVRTERFMPFGVPAKISYTLGYSTKRLIRIDVIMQSSSKPDEVLSFLKTGLNFNNYFAKYDLSKYNIVDSMVVDNGVLLLGLVRKEGKKSGLEIKLLNVKTEKGKDDKVVISSKNGKDTDTGEKRKKPVVFIMTYVADLESYDIFKLEDGDF